MDQKEFNRLTELCDSVLKQFAQHPAIVAIPWLHVLNGHPNSTEQYAYAFTKRSSFSVTGLFFYGIAYSFYKVLSSLTRFNKRMLTGMHKADIVFISHLVSLQEEKSNRDFYYGTLPAFLENEKGLQTLTALIDHTPSVKTISQKRNIEEKGLHRFLFPKTMSFSKECSFVFQCLASFRKLISASYFEKDYERKQILCEAALHALLPETSNALRIQELIQFLLRQSGAGYLVITWEGRSWERLAIKAAEACNSSVKCIAYQHTVLLSSSYAVKRSLGKAYDPDIIAALGETTAEVIRSSRAFPQTDIFPFGSYRIGGRVTGKKNQSGTLQCLVAPEGIESESVLLFGFAIELARQMPGIQFIFRTHPVLPYAWLAAKYSALKELPGNCQLSALTNIHEDFSRCDLLLYRGSSVAIYAVLNGLKPFYYALAGEIAIDPLYLLDEWRVLVENTEAFSKAVAVHKSLSEETRDLQYHTAFSICNAYVKIPDQELFYRAVS